MSTTVWTIQTTAGGTMQVVLPSDHDFYRTVQENAFIELRNSKGEIEMMLQRASIFMVTNKLDVIKNSPILRPDGAAMMKLGG